MRIITNFFFGFAIFVAVSDFTRVRGDVWCTSKPPGAHQVEPGSALNLTCLSRSGQLLVWSKDQENIKDDVKSVQTPGSKVRSLVISIKNASAADSGIYECQVQGVSPYSCQWKLDVFAPPSIKIRNPLYSELLIGASTTIYCGSTGYPPPVFKWLFNGIVIENITNTSFRGRLITTSNQYESNFRVPVAASANSGTYTCVAKNSRGQDEKSTVLVFRDVPKLAVHTVKYRVFEARRRNIRLRCVATDIFKEETKVTWFHNSRQLANHKEQFFSNNTVESVLSMHNVTDEDVGKYWCHVRVYDLKRKSSTLLIRAIEGLPLVSTEHLIVRRRLGERLTLFCCVTFPKYDVITTSWTKNGHIVPQPRTSRYGPNQASDNSSEMFTFSLTIEKFTVDDVGTFQCKAVSVTGLNWTSIKVQIQKQTVQLPSTDPVSTYSLVIIFLVAALGSIFAIVTVLTIRYLYRVKPKRLAAKYKHSASSQDFRYETFLSFSNHDNEWITTHLTPLLDKYSFKYCVTRQDFEVGKAMIENIADCIYQSRTVIAILSKNFMASKHCQQELDLALYKSAELDDGSLIVIRIDSIEKSILPKALRNRTFLDYADTEERRHWERRLLKCLFSHTRNSAKVI